MAIKDALLPEFDQEMKTTRKILERVPDSEFDWKPHEKSMSMGRLAAHIVELLPFSHAILDADSYDVTQGGSGEKKEHRKVADLLSDFDAAVAATREKIASKDDAAMMKTWNFMRGGQTMIAQPRAVMLRSYLMSHLIHHRGQLSVYLRLKNVPVPGAYGPSADEKR